VSKLTPAKRQKRGTALALVGACLHATVTDIKSRASSLPQKATGAVASKLAPTKSDRILEAVVRQDLDHLLGYCRLLSKL
jgi:hypothetical protein